MSKPLLQIIVGSTRPGRVGLPVAEWFLGEAVAHKGFEPELVDLAESRPAALRRAAPSQTEALRALAHQAVERTRRPCRRVCLRDSRVQPRVQRRHQERAGLLEPGVAAQARRLRQLRGEVAAGIRALQMLKPVVSGLKMVPLVEAVNIPFVQQFSGRRAAPSSERGHAGRLGRDARRARPDGGRPASPARPRPGRGGRSGLSRDRTPLPSRSGAPTWPAHPCSGRLIGAVTVTVASRGRSPRAPVRTSGAFLRHRAEGPRPRRGVRRFRGAGGSGCSVVFALLACSDSERCGGGGKVIRFLIAGVLTSPPMR